MPYPTNPDWLNKYGEWKATPQEKPTITNRMFAASDKDFQAACSLADVSPTKAQARKFRVKKGSAYSAKREAERV